MKEALGLTLGALLDIPFDSRSPMQREAIAAAREALAQPDYRAVKTYHEGKLVYVSQPAQEPTLQQQLDKANAEYEKVDAEWDKAASDWDKAYAEVRRIKQLIKEKA